MNSSEAVVQQRQKEGKALKNFLIVSLVGSLAFHAAVMALKVSNTWSNSPTTPENDEMEVVVEDVPPEQEEQITALEPPPQLDAPEVIAEVPEVIAEVPEVIAEVPEVTPPPLAPKSSEPLAKGEDAPTNKPGSAPDATQPMTNSAGDTGLKVGGPIFKPFGAGFGFGNASQPTGFNPLGQPGGDPKGSPGVVSGGTATRTTAPPIPAPAPNQPACISCPKPQYRGSEVSPLVERRIRPDGSVEVRLIKSSGNPETDRETLETMSKWRYDPKTIPEGGIKRRVRVDYEEEGSNRQRQNEERRRQEAEQRQVVEQERQRREAQERQRQQPNTATETPAKSAPPASTTPPASATPLPVEAPPIETVAPTPAAEPAPVEVAPLSEPAPVITPEPAPAEPPPTPAETAPASGQ